MQLYWYLCYHYILEEQFFCSSTWFDILLKTHCSQKQPPKVKNFANFTGKHLCWKATLYLSPKGLRQYRCFPVKFAKFLRLILNNTANDCSYAVWSMVSWYVACICHNRKNKNPQFELPKMIVLWEEQFE